MALSKNPPLIMKHVSLMDTVKESVEYIYRIRVTARFEQIVTMLEDDPHSNTLKMFGGDETWAIEDTRKNGEFSWILFESDVPFSKAQVKKFVKNIQQVERSFELLSSKTVTTDDEAVPVLPP